MKKKVIQFGEGGFLRGFADWMLQLLNDETDFSGSVTVVQPIPQGMCKLLTAQNCRYTHICRGVEGVMEKEINVISECINPYEDFSSYLRLAENPDFRYIISNTTESGIVYSADDSPYDTPPKSFPAKLTLLLKRRFELGLSGFIFLPCELIDKNGDTLCDCILKYADLWGFCADFKAWINNENIFCNTLVDRINTGFPQEEETPEWDKLCNTSEYFHLWVIEGCKELFSELPFDKCALNVILTDNLEKYRTRKVRILNGAHTSMVAFGLLSGFSTVKACIDDPEMLKFIRGCIFDEIIPTLDLPENDLREYAENVITRFKNPYIKHMLSSISLNSVSKFRVRVLPSILEYKKRFNKLPVRLVFSLAKLIELYKADMANDSEAIKEFMKNKSLEEILANTEFWGTDLLFMIEEVRKNVNK